MGSLAVLAKQLGHEVSGSDQNVYPYDEHAARRAGHQSCSGYDPEHIVKNAPDLIVIGNTHQAAILPLNMCLTGAYFGSGPAR